MLLILHIAIALSSLGYTTYLYNSPSRAGVNTALTLVGTTLVSGTALVATTHSNILSTCLTGLVYLGAVSFGIVAARGKLAKALNQ